MSNEINTTMPADGIYTDGNYREPAVGLPEMGDKEREVLVSNVVEALRGISGEKRELIINRQLCHFFRADVRLGLQVAKALEMDIDSITKNLRRQR